MAMDWGSLVQLGSQLIDEGKADRLNEEQMKLIRENYDEWKALGLPDLPHIEAEQQGPSALESTQLDSTGRQAEMDALGRMGDIAKSGGMTLEDQAVLNKFLGKSAQRESAARQGLEQQFAARGQFGSGAQLASALQNQSSGAERNSQAGMDQAAQAERRSLEAIMNQSRMGGSLRDRDWNEQAKKAEAADAIARGNMAAREKSGYYNASLPQQQFNNRTSRLAQQGAAGNNVAAQYGLNAADTRQRGAGYALAARQGINAATSGSRRQTSEPDYSSIYSGEEKDDEGLYNYPE